MMSDGKVLCTVSPSPTSANHFPSPTSFYEYDYVTNTFSSVTAPGGGSTLSTSTYVLNMTCLPDGKVLFSQQGSSVYWIYAPSGAPLAAGKPTIPSTIALERAVNPFLRADTAAVAALALVQAVLGDWKA